MWPPCPSVRLEVDLEAAVEERRVGRCRQRRGAVHRGLDRFAYRLITVTCTDTHLAHFSSGHLGHVQHTFYSWPRRGRPQPRAGDLGGDLRLPACQRRPRARHVRAVLLRETALEVRLALGGLLSLGGAPLALGGGTLARLQRCARTLLGCGTQLRLPPRLLLRGLLLGGAALLRGAALLGGAALLRRAPLLGGRGFHDPPALLLAP